MLSVVMLSVIMLSVIMLNVFMLSAVAPFITTYAPNHKLSLANESRSQTEIQILIDPLFWG
jgi:hypothetical protein